MAIDKEIIQILSDFNQKLNNDTRTSLQKKLDARAAKHGGKKVQSRLFASVKPIPAEYKNGGINIKLVMNDYWVFVNDGRNAGNVSSEGQKKLENWSDTRGFAEKIRITDFNLRTKIQNDAKAKNDNRKKWTKLKKMPFDKAKKAAAFLIARSLKKKNLEPTHFFDEVIKDGRVDKLKEDIAKVVKSEIIIEVQQASK
ncbi:MAG: hypothetical protein ACOVK2_05915 [Candidatus Fonsibacter sp.]